MASSSNKGSKKAYVRFKYCEENLRDAVEAVHRGMTFSAAATTYGVPKSTLHAKCTGKVPDQRKMGPKSILTEAEENCIEKWILGKAQVGFPMHPDEVKDAIQRVMEEAPRENPFTNNRPGEKWMALFLKRHPEIRKKNTDVISKARACVTEEGLRNWFADLRAFLEENDNLGVLDRPRSIFNGDETGVQTCPKSGLLLGAKSEKNFYEIANAKEKECITVLCMFSAAGEAIPPMIVFPYKRIPVHVAQSVPDEWPIGRSDTGWMVHATFYEYVANVFYPWCVKNNVDFPVLLFLDGHKSHISSELREFCVEHRIILYCLPPNSTHIMQPCDVAIFKPLKAHWRKVVNEHKQQTQKAITRANFAPLFKKAFDRLQVNEVTIQNGFRACGLYPFDENAVNYSKCISTRRANLNKEQEDSSISREDFAAAKKVIEHVIGPAKTESFTNSRDTNRGDDDPLFELWTICTDQVECAPTPDNEERIPDTPVRAEKDDVLISADAVPQEIEGDISFPVEESVDVDSGLLIYNIVMECSTTEEKQSNDGECKRVSDENGNDVEEAEESLLASIPIRVGEDCTEEEISMILNEYSQALAADENHNVVDENDKNANVGSEPAVEGIEKDEIHEDGREDGSITTHRRDNSPSDGDLPIARQEKISSKEKNENIILPRAPSSRQNTVHVEKVWEKHLNWPEFEKKEQKKTAKPSLPYAITSTKWKQYHEAVQHEREEKERKAEERLILRNIKKESTEAAKAEKAKARAEKEREKQEKITEKEEKAKAKADKEREKQKKATENEEKARMAAEQTSRPKTRQSSRKKK